MPFNRILLDKDREQLSYIIREMYEYIPEMTHNKIPNALVQQAFVYETAVILADPAKENMVLSVGGYHDTASELMKFRGWRVYEIDPAFNCTLNVFKSRAIQKYDFILATSVLEHVQDDQEFIRDVCELLTTGGHCIITCDFKNDWNPGERTPYTSNRFYRKIDLLERLPNIFRQYGCEFIDTPDYNAQDNFVYDGIQYSFATMVFKKGK